MNGEKSASGQKLAAAVYILQACEYRHKRNIRSTFLRLLTSCQTAIQQRAHQVAKGLAAIDFVLSNQKEMETYFQLWRRNVSFTEASLLKATAAIDLTDLYSMEIPPVVRPIVHATESWTLQPHRLKLGSLKLKQLLQVRLFSATLQIRTYIEHRRTVKKLQKALLKNLSKMVELTAKQRLSNSLRQWKSSCTCKPLHKDYVTSDKLKGRLLSVLGTHIHPGMSQSRAFLRWKVRTDSTSTRQAIAKFSLYSRINPHTALWRLKSVLSSYRLQQARLARRKRIEQALILFQGLMKPWLKLGASQAFLKLKQEWFNKLLMLKELEKIAQVRKMKQTKGFSQWRKATEHQKRDHKDQL